MQLTLKITEKILDTGPILPFVDLLDSTEFCQLFLLQPRKR